MSSCEAGRDVNVYKVEDADQRPVSAFFKPEINDKDPPPKKGIFQTAGNLSMLPSLYINLNI